MRRLVLALVLLAAGCSGTDPSSRPTTTAAEQTTTSATATTTEAPQPQTAPLTVPDAPQEIVYFLMIDRFANGDPTNDRGGIDTEDDPLVHGFLASDKGYFHGGDLAGVLESLDYIEGLGATAIWITPPLRNRVVQGRGEVSNSSAGYHGYWIVDFESIDPHFGTGEDLGELVSAAHARGIDVYLDIVANHTADVITTAENSFSYRSVKFAPYRDAAGVEFDVTDYVGSGQFPELDPAISFPYSPVFANEDDAAAKNPEWLNDPIYYHNRGNTNFTGENDQLGDFYGLDDLFTEHPRVVSGMIGIYQDLIEEYGVDGFRVDTARHVNDEFWLEFLPAIRSHAVELGLTDFFVFGEVSGSDPVFNSRYMSEIGFPSVLDFGFSAAVGTFVAGRAGPKALADLFEDDDWFTSADRDARSLVTFVGNHDQGRVGFGVLSGNPGAGDEELLRRVGMAFELLFTTRGQPTVYYGDEQGFVGDGGDRDARQDMFPSLVDSYNDDDLIGTDLTTADANFDTGHPLYLLVQDLSDLRRRHPALSTGVQLTRYSQVNEGAFAFSRVDTEELVEYLIVVNNSETGQAVEFETSTAGARFDVVYPGGAGVESDESGRAAVLVPPLSTTVYRADRPIDPATVVGIGITRPGAGSVVELERFRLEAEVEGTGLAALSFAVTVGAELIPLGTDWAPPYRVYWDSSGYPSGAEVTVTVTARDPFGLEKTATSDFVLGERE